MGYEHKELGYPFHWSLGEAVSSGQDSKKLLENKTPRNFPVYCTVKHCLFNSSKNRDDGLGNCDRYEVFNTLDVLEMEISDKNECYGYSGSHRRLTFGSVKISN